MVILTERDVPHVRQRNTHGGKKCWGKMFFFHIGGKSDIRDSITRGGIKGLYAGVEAALLSFPVQDSEVSRGVVAVSVIPLISDNECSCFGFGLPLALLHEGTMCFRRERSRRSATSCCCARSLISSRTAQSCSTACTFTLS
jgi:hypothetical protein